MIRRYVRSEAPQQRGRGRLGGGGTMKRHDILGCGLAAVAAGGLELASFPVQA